MRIFTLLLMMMLSILLAPPAFATAHTVTTTQSWAVKRTTQPTSTGVIFFESEFDIGRCDDDASCPHNREQGTWASSWSYVTCAAHYEAGQGRNWYSMVFHAVPGSWPTTWPSSVTCYGASGSDSILATVNLSNAEDSDWVSDPITALSFSTGKSISLPNNGTYKTSADVFNYSLPAGSYLSQQFADCMKGGVVWPEVSTSVYEVSGGTDEISIYVGATSPAGTGTCRAKKDGVWTTFPVTITRL